jgi:death-on-curing family protein
MKDKNAVRNIGEIVIFQSKDKKVRLEVNLHEETIWLTQAQISALFGTQRPAITKHIRNIFKSGELNKNSVSSILEHTASDGKVYKTQYYNLDAVISIGYRVNSKRATQFRIWATKVLKDYIVKGYTFNHKRISELKTKRLAEFSDAVSLIRKTIENRQLSSGEESGLLKVITEYAHSWILLQQYDKGKISVSAKICKESCELKYCEAKKAIEELKKNLLVKKEASELFGHEKANGMEQIIGGIYQTFDGRELYQGVEEKAAHLLYFIIKDHPFTDGNKRIASFLFIVFLARNNCLLKKNGEHKINDNALVALALLIAESAPKQKDIMIKLVMNFLAG